MDYQKEDWSLCTAGLLYGIHQQVNNPITKTRMFGQKYSCVLKGFFLVLKSYNALHNGTCRLAMHASAREIDEIYFSFECVEYLN